MNPLQPQTADLQPLLTVRQVCERLSLSRPTIDRLVVRGELTKIKLGAAVRNRSEDVERLIERAAGGET